MEPVQVDAPAKPVKPTTNIVGRIFAIVVLSALGATLLGAAAAVVRWGFGLG